MYTCLLIYIHIEHYIFLFHTDLLAFQLVAEPTCSHRRQADRPPTSHDRQLEPNIAAWSFTLVTELVAHAKDSVAAGSLPIHIGT